MAKKPTPNQNHLSADEVRELIRMEIENRKWTQKEYAAKCGISQAFASDVLRGYRLPGKAMLSRLKLREVILYAAK